MEEAGEAHTMPKVAPPGTPVFFAGPPWPRALHCFLGIRVVGVGMLRPSLAGPALGPSLRGGGSGEEELEE